MQDHEINPWIRQYAQDLKACAEFDDMVFVCESLSTTLLEIIEDEDVRQAFVRFDPKV